MNIFLQSNKIWLYLFVATFFLQILFSIKTENIKPNYNLIPNPPNQYQANIYKLLDKEFSFRILAFKIQNAGDVFAGFVPLKNYDYEKLYEWFNFLDSLNHKSHLTPSIASYLYANIKDEKKVRIILKYLQNHANQDLEANWWWLFQAIYLSSNVLQDNDEALKIAYRLSEVKNEKAPLWTKQMPAFIHIKKGENCQAFQIMKAIIDDVNSRKTKVSIEEINFMRYFINVRLKKLKENNFDLKKSSCLGG